jgi:uncharacterized membrane protein YhaH (DUF805 family)
LLKIIKKNKHIVKPKFKKMKEHFLDVITNHYADFNGRARRKEYWMFVLFNFVVSLVLGIVMGLISQTAANAVSIIYTLALLLPGLSLGVRRLHDTGKSGWFMLIGLIPLVGAIILLIFYCLDSQPGTNEYGPNPKGIN